MTATAAPAEGGAAAPGAAPRLSESTRTIDKHVKNVWNAVWGVVGDVITMPIKTVVTEPISKVGKALGYHSDAKGLAAVEEVAEKTGGLAGKVISKPIELGARVIKTTGDVGGAVVGGGLSALLKLPLIPLKMIRNFFGYRIWGKPVPNGGGHAAPAGHAAAAAAGGHTPAGAH